MKRIRLLLAVVALMVVMLAMTVAPAFAAPPETTSASQVLLGFFDRFAGFVGLHREVAPSER